MTLAEANIKFTSTGSNEVKVQIEGVGKALDSTANKAEKASLSIMKIAAGNIVGNLLQRLADSAFDLGKNVLEMGMNFQTTNAQFEALGMNATKTRSFISDVASASTLTTKELTSLAQSVQLSGFNIYRVLPAFAKLADLAGKDQDKLQGMVRLLNVLKTGARPDQELLQGLKMPTLLAEAGLKFDKGKLVGDINSALESVIKVIESKTAGVSKALGKTFEASFSSLVDQFDKIKETLGNKILQWAQPWVDSLRVVLQAMTSSGSWDRFLNQFFYYGDQANKKLKNGLLNQETLFAISDFITRILSNIAFFPARLQIIFKEIGPAVKEFFSKLQEDPTIKGFFAIFRKIGEMESKASANEIRNRALIDLEKKGFITRAESISASAGYPSESTQKLLDQFMMIQNMRKNQPTKLEGMFTQLNAVSEKQRKYFELESARNRAAIKGLSDKGLEVKGTGKVTLPGTMLGDPTEVEKDKKVKEKQTRALDIIAINTQKANELTLRNMTYGGGVLASQGISEAQMARNRSVKSPQISATNDISRGVEKMIRSYNNSNNLNFSFRRA
jgi:hypothetical protein